MIVDWSDIKVNFRGAHLLLGNGFSINVSRNFGYAKLKEASDFPKRIRTLFNLREEETDNFEEVLLKLATALDALKILKGSKESQEVIAEAYKEIREGLYDAVSNVHCNKNEFLEENCNFIDDIRKHLLKYKSIFTTNYDLILSWIILSEPGGDGFTDYFFAEKFDLDDTELWGNKVPVHYLHGALFLNSDAYSQTYKLNGVSGYRDNVSAIKKKTLQKNRYPLIVTEGDYLEKIRSIIKNDYLFFCFNQLMKTTGKFIIYGHSLDKVYDAHIIDALNNSNNKIAISIYKGRKNNNTLISEVIKYKEKLNKVSDIYFFYTNTHPLNALGEV